MIDMGKHSVYSLFTFPGQNLPSFLPELDSLLQSDDLGLLKDDDTFQYLMSAGYEHIQQML